MTISTLPFAPQNVMNRKELKLRAGDTVRVYTKIEEKGKIRLQMFEGLILATKHGAETGATFTVRKISHGVGVERVFPLYSPAIEKIEIIKRSQVRRAKLYYLRNKVARDIRRKMRNFIEFFASTEDLQKARDAAIAETPDVIPELKIEANPETTEIPATENKEA